MVKTSMNKKAFELYQGFDDWVSAHKHSTPAIYSELQVSLEAGNDDVPDSLKGYISALEVLRSEIDSEISEARDWIEYFERHRGDLDDTGV